MKRTFYTVRKWLRKYFPIIQLVVLNRKIVKKEKYQIKWPRVSFLIWCHDMYTLTQPIVVTVCNAGIRSAIYNHSIWEKVIAVQMLSESIQISLFTFFFQNLFPFG